MNAITIYASMWYISLESTRDFFFKGFANTLSDASHQQLALATGLILVQWLLLYGLYRKKIFIRV
jgi:hypothetical protein